MKTKTYELGFNLDRTYDRRRHAIQELRRDAAIDIYDAVEMDYDPADEGEIRSFLDEAAFDYAIGTVHHVEEVNVHTESYFAEKSKQERINCVEKYYDSVLSLIESELFDIVAHIDLVERNQYLRRYSTTEQYETIAAALSRATALPEINAGRIHSLERLHPGEEFFEVLRDANVEFVFGSDS